MLYFEEKNIIHHFEKYMSYSKQNCHSGDLESWKLDAARFYCTAIYFSLGFFGFHLEFLAK